MEAAAPVAEGCGFGRTFQGVMPRSRLLAWWTRSVWAANWQERVERAPHCATDGWNHLGRQSGESDLRLRGRETRWQHRPPMRAMSRKGA